MTKAELSAENTRLRDENEVLKSKVSTFKGVMDTILLLLNNTDTGV